MKMNRVVDDQILHEPLPPDEPFLGGEATRLHGMSILNYWQWGVSGIVGNTERGNLAEFLVAHAIEATDRVRNTWDDYDLITKELIKVEVKSAAFIQSWKQPRLSSPRFSIAKTKGSWDFSDSLPETRYADVYVFCLLSHLHKETINPMDVSQWKFYLLKTTEIEQDLSNAKSISLKALRTRSRQYQYQELHSGIRTLINSG
jgi:hypothetical protein